MRHVLAVTLLVALAGCAAAPGEGRGGGLRDGTSGPLADVMPEATAFAGNQSVPIDPPLPRVRVDNETGTVFFVQPKERAVFRVLLDVAVDGLQPVLTFQDLASNGSEDFGWGSAIWSTPPDPRSGCMQPKGSGYFQETGVTPAATFGGSLFQLHPALDAGQHEAWVWGWGFKGTIALSFGEGDRNVTVASVRAPWQVPGFTAQDFDESAEGTLEFGNAAYVQVTSRVTRALGDDSSWSRDLQVHEPAGGVCAEFHDAGDGQIVGGDSPEDALLVTGGGLDRLAYRVALSGAVLPATVGSSSIAIEAITFAPLA